MLNWIANFIVQMTFLELVNVFGDAGTWWVSIWLERGKKEEGDCNFVILLFSKIYAGCSGVILVFTIFFVPETKNISLEELERKLVKEQ
jgi:MFS transporter, SP family, galactose:H+ symporter